MIKQECFPAFDKIILKPKSEIDFNEINNKDITTTFLNTNYFCQIVTNGQIKNHLINSGIISEQIQQEIDKSIFNPGDMAFMVNGLVTQCTSPELNKNVETQPYCVLKINNNYTVRNCDFIHETIYKRPGEHIMLNNTESTAKYYCAKYESQNLSYSERITVYDSFKVDTDENIVKYFDSDTYFYLLNKNILVNGTEKLCYHWFYVETAREISFKGLSNNTYIAIGKQNYFRAYNDWPVGTQYIL